MAWNLPSVNTTRQASSSSLPHPIAAEHSVPNPNPTNLITFDPKDNTSPYHLHANESPTVELVSCMLDRNNYNEWARAMKVALSSKNKFGFVNGAIKMPNVDDPRTILWIDTAEGVWEDLKKRFSKQDVFRIVEIQAEIYQTKQGSSSVNEYFAKLKLLWDEFRILRPTPTCICTQKRKCSDDFLDKTAVNLENDMLCAFLIGLDDKYTRARNQIMLMRPLPDEVQCLSKETSIIPAEPNQCVATVASQGTPLRNVTRNMDILPDGNLEGRMLGQPIKSVHKKASSLVNQDGYKKYLEFLEYMQKERSTPLDAGGTGTTPQANIIATNFVPNTESEGKATTKISSEYKSMWILDSGATHHIVCDRSLLTNCRKVDGKYVALPNGNKATITHIGSVHLSNMLVLQGVLCVPVFYYNLISIGELIKTSGYQVLMHSNRCIIQNPHLGRMIGTAELRDGLYHLTVPADSALHCIPLVNYVANNMWHSRLGHASHAKIKFLQSLNVNINAGKDSVCDCCHLAKQKRIPFIPSKSSTTDCFHLVHMDIWGPYHVRTMFGHQYFLTIVDDFSRATWAYLLRGKDEVRQLVQGFYAMIHTQFGKMVKCVRTDNGKEFLMPEFYLQKGIVHQTSCVYTPQ
ncbi:uncharacterized protein LOC115999338 [Ipomoea triloba]|uniref:uncharacterized protein LOC115999338 n=1 Tax=Ipomoea triloba TaxID=35885 RepID=UPI00125CECCE|nr:uncharacterized protein LOC115999338 [Ipomoea triloba]